MAFRLICLSILVLTFASCGNKTCTDKACSSKALSCKLTSTAMRERKATVIASLQKQIVEKKELEKGYTFKFSKSEAIDKELAEFTKSEKECCDFFEFKVSTTEDNKWVWLEISGPDGAKDFIKTEMGL